MTEALTERFRAAFSREPTILAKAPGRVEFIGNHTDYNGGPVLGAALDRCVWVALAPREDGKRRLASEQKSGILEVAPGPLAKATGSGSWANYPLGVLSAMAKSGVPVPAGFDYMAAANVPVGAGLSSSAAIELASCLAFAEAAGATLETEKLVAIGRKAENEFVGVPCGILDQGVSGFGKKDHLVHIDCRGPKFDTVPLPHGAHFWIFNTHTKHALIDGLYSARHQECMDAAKGIGVPLLVDATPEMLAAAEKRLSRTAYKRARHVIDEIGRVSSAVEALQKGDLPAVGKLLYASHRSSRTWFENSTPELDFLVGRLEGVKGVYGARLTGGGFGGAVMALTSGDFGAESAAEVTEAYFAKYSSKLEAIHAETGDGATLLKRAR